MYYRGVRELPKPNRELLEPEELLERKGKPPTEQKAQGDIDSSHDLKFSPLGPRQSLYLLLLSD